MAEMPTGLGRGPENRCERCVRDLWGRKAMRLAEEILDLPSTGPFDFIGKLMTHSIDGTVCIIGADRANELWAAAFALLGECGSTEVSGDVWAPEQARDFVAALPRHLPNG